MAPSSLPRPPGPRPCTQPWQLLTRLVTSCRGAGRWPWNRYTALHTTGPCCTKLNFTALYCTVPHCTALHVTKLHCTALHCTALHCTAPYCTTLKSDDLKTRFEFILHWKSTAVHFTQYSTVHCITLYTVHWRVVRKHRGTWETEKL